MQGRIQDRHAGIPAHHALPHRVAIVVSALVCLASPLAHAQYRCIQPGGSVSYQQTPCAAEAKGRKIELSSSATSTPGGKEDRTDWAAVIKGPAGRTTSAGAPSAAGSPGAADEAAPAPRNCATPQQIKSMEYEASKLANRHDREMQRDLALARACR